MIHPHLATSQVLERITAICHPIQTPGTRATLKVDNACKARKAFARRVLDAARIAAFGMGLRFGGIVEEAPRWGTKGFDLLLNTFEDILMMSIAIFGSVPRT